MQEIYCDNAATSYPKPPEVLKAIENYTKNIGASAGRGAYPRALAAGEMILSCRKKLAHLFNIPDPKRVIFTLNATDGLNLAIKGLPLRAGDEVVISMMEHNSVLRPLHELRERKRIRVVRIGCQKDGSLDLRAVKASITKRTRLIALIHASNVCGTILPIEEVGALARRKGIPFLVDAAQTAGAFPIDVQKMKIDILAFPGHKALLGPLGTGGLYIGPRVEIRTLKEGGTGSISEKESQPDFFPDRYEAGSHNALGIAGLSAALDFILKKGIHKIRRHKEALTEQFLEGARRIPNLRVYGPADERRRVSVLSVNIDSMKPGKLSSLLYKRFGLMTRFGLHCSGPAHRTLGTFSDGTVRFSFGIFNTPAHVSRALSALRALSKKA